MKQLHLIILLGLLSLTSGLQAQEQAEQGEQLLVFRNTGVVDLLYTNRVDSILTTDSTQVFYAKDTTLVVPFTELDSVAVGSRNVREMNASVRELTNDRDLPWIIRVEGNHIYYRLNTPQDILPKIGDKLFYGESHNLFPIGLSAKVINMTYLAEEIDVEIEPVELHEIFDRFFYAGRVTMSDMPAETRYLMRRANHDRKVIPIEGKLDVEDYGEVFAQCQLELTGNYVVDVFFHYYHGHIKGEFSGEVGAKLKCDNNTECHPTIPLLYLPLPTVAGVLYPSVYVNLFTDLNAELNLNFSARKVYRFEYDWTRKDGKQWGEVVSPTEGRAEDEEVKTDMTLAGQLHMGAQAGVGLNLIGNRVGFRFESKMGPCLEGEFGIGVLSKMRDFDSEL
jgi:3D (Asp-Asp-Asp) domain-containing protein